jgi:Tfp pilus assembly protein PilF
MAFGAANSIWHCRRGWAALAGGLCLVCGCLQLDQRPGTTIVEPPTALTGESSPKLTPAQKADVQIAYGRTLEKRGALDQAQAIYLDALQHDPSRADACARLAVLSDQQGKFEESSKWHQKALAAQPSNADFLCNQGYSFYLQGHLAEGEANLRQCLSLAPDHARAHNNLGLILGRTGRRDEALAEFRRAGCNEAEALSNLAYALTLERQLPEARMCYERAAAMDSSPTSPARKGLAELDALSSKLSDPRP